MVEINLYLARHGETSANASGVLQGSSINLSLNELGVQQAEALSDRGLKDKPVDLIVTSALARAIETGEIINRHHNAPMHQDARLNEISWGDLDGRPFSEIRSELGALTSKWTQGQFEAKPPGSTGESVKECQDRILSFFRDVLALALEKGYRNIVCCLHGRLLRVIMASLVDKDLRVMSKYNHVNCCYHQLRVTVEEGKSVDPSDLAFVPLGINVRTHLESFDDSMMDL